MNAARRSEEAVIGDLLSAADDAAELVRRGRDAYDGDVLLRRAGEAITGQVTEAAGAIADHEPDGSLEGHGEVAGGLVQGPVGLAVMPARWTRRVSSSMKNRTCSRRSWRP